MSVITNVPFEIRADEYHVVIERRSAVAKFVRRELNRGIETKWNRISCLECLHHDKKWIPDSRLRAIVTPSLDSRLRFWHEGRPVDNQQRPATYPNVAVIAKSGFDTSDELDIIRWLVVLGDQDFIF